MRWPWIKRSTFVRELTEARRAYREDAEAGLRKEREYTERIGRLTRAHTQRDIATGDLSIVIRIPRTVLEQPDAPRIAAERVVSDLTRFSRDHRADLRQHDLTGQRYSL